MLEQLLSTLGLTDYEARVYAALLTHSPASATTIAKKCGLSRSSVYTTLYTLIAQGLVGTTYKNEVKQFVAQDVTVLKEHVRKEEETIIKKHDAFTKLQSAMDTLGVSSAAIPRVIFFEGQEGLKKVYLSMLRNAAAHTSLVVVRDEFVWRDEWKFVFGKDWHERIKRIRTEKNIVTELYINDSKTERSHASYYKNREGLRVHWLPKKMLITNFALYIIADIVSILSMEHGLMLGVQITNPVIADNMRQMVKGMG